MPKIDPISIAMPTQAAHDDLHKMLCSMPGETREEQLRFALSACAE